MDKKEVLAVLKQAFLDGEIKIEIESESDFMYGQDCWKHTPVVIMNGETVWEGGAFNTPAFQM